MNIEDYINYDKHTGEFTWKLSTTPRVVVGQKAGSVNKRSGYVELRVKGIHFYGHRVAWYLTHGYFPRITDHINHNRSDNRIINLREVNQSQNTRNAGKSKNNTQGITGVYAMPQNSGKWRAVITVNYKPIHLGVFNNIEEAIAARVAAKLKYNFHRNHS